MFNFEQYLLDNEKILYQGKSVPGKGSKNIGIALFIILFMLVCQVLLILAITKEIKKGRFEMLFPFILFFGVTLLFDAAGIYLLVYNLFIKKKAVAGNYYCLTNLRALKYEAKKDKLVFGYLIDYKDIRVDSEKDEYGNVYMAKNLRKLEIDNQNLSTVKEVSSNSDQKGMLSITFESVENPYWIVNLAKEARQSLLEETFAEIGNQQNN